MQFKSGSISLNFRFPRTLWHRLDSGLGGDAHIFALWWLEHLLHGLPLAHNVPSSRTLSALRARTVRTLHMGPHFSQAVADTSNDIHKSLPIEGDLEVYEGDTKEWYERLWIWVCKGPASTRSGFKDTVSFFFLFFSGPPP